jgi:hypothetical protein
MVKVPLGAVLVSVVEGEVVEEEAVMVELDAADVVVLVVGVPLHRFSTASLALSRKDTEVVALTLAKPKEPSQREIPPKPL